MFFYKLPSKCLRECGTVETINKLRGSNRLSFKAFNVGKCTVNALDDFGPFFGWSNWDEVAPQVGEVDVLKSSPNPYHLFLHLR